MSNNQQTESINLKFTFKESQEKLTIIALNLENYIQYVGFMTSHIVKDLSLIKELIDKKEYKITQINDKSITIKTSLTTFELIESTENIKGLESIIKEFENKHEELQKIIKEKDQQILELKNIIRQYKNEFGLLEEVSEEKKSITLQVCEPSESMKRILEGKNKASSINEKNIIKTDESKHQTEKKDENNTDLLPLNLPIEKINWGETLKYKTIEIEGNIIKNTETVDDACFSLLNVGFNSNLKRKQCWGIKILSSESQIGVGICSQYVIENVKYGEKRLEWYNTGHGCYVVTNHGFCYSHSSKKQNESEKFKFKDGDVIYMEYDPIEWKMRFQRNDDPEKFEMSIIPPKTYDTYHPFVEMTFEDTEAELILPGKALS